MWEILSFAEKPYSGMKKDQVKDKLRSMNHMMDPPNNYMRFDKERYARYVGIASMWMWNRVKYLI